MDSTFMRYVPSYWLRGYTSLEWILNASPRVRVFAPLHHGNVPEMCSLTRLTHCIDEPLKGGSKRSI